MRRLRALTPLLAALLAFAGVPGPWHGYEPLLVARIAGADARTVTRDVIHAGIPHQSPHYLGTEAGSLDHAIDRHEPLGRLLPRWSRPLDSAPIGPVLLAGERSRVRALDRARLDYASLVARARMGTLSAHATTLPPPSVA